MPSVAFQTDGPGCRDLHGFIEDIAITGAMGHAAFHGNNHLVPFLWLVVLQVLPGPGEGVVPALKLWLTDENAAVGIGGGTKFELKDKVLRELPGGPELLNPTTFRRGW